MSATRHTSFANPLRRLIAAGSTVLVLALTIFAASPAAHDWLHAAAGGCSTHADQHPEGSTADDTGCAVVLFAGGISLPVSPAALTPPILAPQGVSPITAAEFFLVSPRYLRQPERGPPLSWVR